MPSDLPYSPGLDVRYGASLARHVQMMKVGDSIFWRPDGWYKSAPGVEFVKDATGFLRPVRRKRES